MKKSTIEAVETFINGNISTFKTWLKRASKADVLDAIEYYGEIEPALQSEFISTLKRYLTN